jgi:hypothetical protein
MAELVDVTKFIVRKELLEDGHVLRDAARCTCTLSPHAP